MSPAWSYVLTAVGVLGLLLAGSRKRVGWALGLAAQPLWAVYAVMTGQWGFILSAVVYGGVYLRNWLKWRREAGQVMVAPAWRTHREMVSYSPGRYPRIPPPLSEPPPPPPEPWNRRFRGVMEDPPRVAHTPGCLGDRGIAAQTCPAPSHRKD